jgi:hypothetical protein
LGFDGNAPFTFQIHGIQDLLGHFPIRQATAQLNEAVGNGGFAVVNVGDNGKISNKLHIRHAALPTT